MLEARCLEKRFKKGLWGHTAPVVQDVSLCINPGETIGLIGDSGSGKSTIARMMTRLIRPSKGAVFLDGMDIDAFSNDQMQRFRRSVQMIFQDPNHALNPKKTISWSMREPILAHAIASSPLDADRIIRSLFQETGLSPEIRTRFPSEISGGQAQRVVIARALSLSPRFLVADEPTSMLDLSVQAMILELLRQLQQKHNLGIFLISHDPGVVKKFCDRILYVDRGRITQGGHDALIEEHSTKAEFMYETT